MTQRRRGGGRKSAAKQTTTQATSGRGLTVRVKSARGRTVGSTRWLQRQLNDPYVARAKADGYRSRAAYKLLELDEKFHFLKSGLKVVDLGAAPGGWTQVAVARVKADSPGRGVVVAIDINEWEAVSGAICSTLDFLDPSAPEKLKKSLGGQADVVMSDMAAPATGHRPTDHIRIMGLAEIAWDFAADVLAPGGVFICKVLQGGTEGELLKQIKKRCETVRHAKPPASRQDSAEVYLVATGFKG
jgi:23S rRNA (uridine2552-2'-O)-methyltransferase